MEPEFSFWFPETASPAFWPKDFLDIVSYCAGRFDVLMSETHWDSG
jgi:hypothetical protein